MTVRSVHTYIASHITATPLPHGTRTAPIPRRSGSLPLGSGQRTRIGGQPHSTQYLGARHA